LAVFFALELEDVYRHAEGAHRALAFPDFVGLLVGMGLEAYRKGNVTTLIGKNEAPEDQNVEDDNLENGLAYCTEKDYIEERQQAGVKIIAFPAASLLDNSFTGFLNETGGANFKAASRAFYRKWVT
jgi:hypothetical protein